MQLGEFSVDTEQQILFMKAEEVQAEPRIIELLIYLLRHRERYVKLEELHQQVWAGRIVSDTAVRNVIKKLRTVLGDSDLANSRYIKSVPKRGYKLICKVDVYLAPSTQKKESREDELLPYVVYEQAEQILNSSGGTNNETVIIRRNDSLLLKRGGLFLFILLLSLTLWAWLPISSDKFTKTILPNYHFELISNFPGEKYGITESKNGKFIAFTGKTNINQNSQVYLLDKSTNEIKQITQSARSATDLIFVKNDSAIIYNDTVYGSFSLNLIDLNRSEIQTEILLQNIKVMGRVTEGIKNNFIIVPLMTEQAPSVMLYSLNLETKELIRLTSTSSQDFYDYMVTVSPNSELLAIAQIEKNKNYISIKSVNDLEELNKFQFERQLINFVWKNNAVLYFLDKKGLTELNVYTGKKTFLLREYSGLFKNFTMNSQSELLFIKNNEGLANRIFVEKSLDDLEHSKRLFDVEQNITSMIYLPTKNDFLITQKKNDFYQLAYYQADIREVTPLIQNEKYKKMEMLEVAKTKSLILLLINARLVLFNYETMESTFLSSSSQYINDAIFSKDEKSILFGEKVAEQWNIYQKTFIKSVMPSLFIKGYRSIRHNKSGYIVANSDGNLFTLSEKKGDILALDHIIDYFDITRWYVNNDTIIWTTTDYLYTTLHTLNLATKDYNFVSYSFKLFFPRFFVDLKSQKLLHKHVQIKQSNIVKLNFGDK